MGQLTRDVPMYHVHAGETEEKKWIQQQSKDYSLVLMLKKEYIEPGCIFFITLDKKNGIE